MGADGMGTELARLKVALLDLLKGGFANYGFQPRPREQAYYKRTSSGWWAVAIRFIDHPGRTVTDVMASVALRVNAVEELVGATKRSATIGAELGNIADHRFMSWPLASDADLAPVSEAVVKEFANWGFPYLQRYSDSEKLLEVLSNNDTSGWLHSPIHVARCERAVALAILLDRRELARKLAWQGDEFLDRRQEIGLSSYREFIARVLGEKSGALVGQGDPVAEKRQQEIKGHAQERLHALYDSLRPGITGSRTMKIREWLMGWSIEAQIDFGTNALKAMESVGDSPW